MYPVFREKALHLAGIQLLKVTVCFHSKRDVNCLL